MIPVLLITHQKSTCDVWPRLLAQIALPQKHQLLKLLLQELMRTTRGNNHNG